MTSLIFGSIYMGHKGIIEHRREKQRKQNYQRWEDLRDDYDAQRKITRETRSLDIQRTGTGNYFGNGSDDNDRPILTLRDQQEANDARTGWRPQEVFDGPTGGGGGRRSMDSRPTYESGAATLPPLQHQQSTMPALKPAKTGATWDEGLPAPLQVSRRQYDERGSWSETPTTHHSRSVTPRDERSVLPAGPVAAAAAADMRSVSMPSTLQYTEQPVENRMAELIAGSKTPGVEEPVEMEEWWKR